MNSLQMKKKYKAVISTLTSSKEGFGHLNRSITLYKALESLSISSLLIVESPDNIFEAICEREEVHYQHIFSFPEEKILLKKITSEETILFIDKRDTYVGYKTFLKCLIIGIDNVGEDQHFFDILYNPLPHFHEYEANIKNPLFLYFPNYLYDYCKEKTGESKQPPQKLLISFGGSDPYDLSTYTVELLSQYQAPYDITLILGPLYKGKLIHMGKKFTHNIDIIGALPSHQMYQIMKKSDLLLTSFGITIFESLIIKLPFVLLNHSHYHQKLAKATGLEKISFPFTGEDLNQINPQDVYKLMREIFHKAFLPEIPMPTKNQDIFISFLKDILTFKPFICPHCQSTTHQIIQRHELFNLYHCDIYATNMYHHFPWKECQFFFKKEKPELM